jgi:putative aldouronate transport system permease protein
VKHDTFSDRIFDKITYFLLIMSIFICIYPLYYTVICSISDPYSVSMGKVGLIPVGFSLQSYKLVFANKEIWSGYFYTIVYTIGGTLFDLFLTIPLAYALSKKDIPGRKALSWYFLFTMYFGGGMIPTYLIIQQMGLLNHPVIMMVASGINIFNLIVCRVFFEKSIPNEIYEAARIDGCSEILMFYKIAIPLSAPIIAVIALYYGFAHWNDYFTALIYMTNKKYQPLQLVLRRILIQNENAIDAALASEISGDMLKSAAQRSYIAVTMKYSLVFIASAPMLIAYPFVQKYFVKGIIVGSLKG